MLDLKRMAAAAPRVRVPEALRPLLTPWGEGLDFTHILAEHPHPQFERASFLTINGLWDFSLIDAGEEAASAWATTPPPESYDAQIIVPFTPETVLSGVNRHVLPTNLLWYRRRIAHAEICRAAAGGTAWDGRLRDARVILHFEAVDYACSCWVNGTCVGTHVGGYLPFSFDITDAVRDSFCRQGPSGGDAPEGDGVVVELCVFDPSDEGVQLRGKQRLEREGIWYTSQAGIWQPVWIEAVPKDHIVKAHLFPQADKGCVVVEAEVAGTQRLAAKLFDEQGNFVSLSSCEAADGRAHVTLPVQDVHLWSPEQPVLYGLELSFGDDVVRSYTAFREIELRLDADGHRYFYLNGEKLLLKGVLDQGYWSDGMLTAPSDEALIYDIEAMKRLDFNMLRKHIKIESDRWYYHCDRLGMLVWQDMVTGGGPYSDWQTSYKPSFFRASWSKFDDENPNRWKDTGAESELYRLEWLDTMVEAIEHLKNHPSIVAWVLFNEAWGQFEAREVTRIARREDPTRLIDAASGWYDRQCGDFLSVHNYFRPLAVWPDRSGVKPTRAFVISEFGGLNLYIDGHSALSQSYGYENFSDAGAWQNAVRAELAKAESLFGSGLAGYVYTQLSDVEEETNGLLTYDRKVDKMGIRPHEEEGLR